MIEYLLITVFLTTIFVFLYNFMGVYLQKGFSDAAGIILRVYS